MFAKLALLATLVGLAAPLSVRQIASNPCSSGTLECCEGPTSSTDPATSAILGLLGIVLGGLNIPVGLNCATPEILPIGGAQCDNTLVCCDQLAAGGVIGINCNPATSSTGL